MARRLDDRMCTIERIMNAENPNWQQAYTLQFVNKGVGLELRPQN